MKFLAFKETEDDRGNDLLERIPLFDDFDTAEDVLAWLATIEGSYSGTRYLVVAATGWVTAIMKENPVTRYAHIDGWDDATAQWKKNQEAYRVKRGLPAYIPTRQGTT